MGSRDEDDWAGTPPEGRHGGDRADPGHWARQWRMYSVVMGVLGLLVIAVVLLAVL